MYVGIAVTLLNNLRNKQKIILRPLNKGKDLSIDVYLNLLLVILHGVIFYISTGLIQVIKLFLFKVNCSRMFLLHKSVFLAGGGDQRIFYDIQSQVN